MASYHGLTPPDAAQATVAQPSKSHDAAGAVVPPSSSADRWPRPHEDPRPPAVPDHLADAGAGFTAATAKVGVCASILYHGVPTSSGEPAFATRSLVSSATPLRLVAPPDGEPNVAKKSKAVDERGPSGPSGGGAADVEYPVLATRPSMAHLACCGPSYSMDIVDGYAVEAWAADLDRSFVKSTRNALCCHGNGNSNPPSPRLVTGSPRPCGVGHPLGTKRKRAHSSSDHVEMSKRRPNSWSRAETAQVGGDGGGRDIGTAPVLFNSTSALYPEVGSFCRMRVS